KELLEVLKEILLIKQEGLNIDQRTSLELRDNVIKQAQFLLDIKKQELEISETILGLQAERLRFLQQEGLILVPEAREREIQIKRKRLRIIQERIKEIQKERDLVVARKTENITSGTGRGVSQGDVAIIQASPEISDLNKQLIELQGEADGSKDRLDLTASALGRLRTGLQ